MSTLPPRSLRSATGQLGRERLELGAVRADHLAHGLGVDRVGRLDHLRGAAVLGRGDVPLPLLELRARGLARLSAGDELLVGTIDLVVRRFADERVERAAA